MRYEPIINIIIIIFIVSLLITWFVSFRGWALQSRRHWNDREKSQMQRSSNPSLKVKLKLALFFFLRRGLHLLLKVCHASVWWAEYEKNGLPQNFVDQVFGGEMTSTIMCQQCKTVPQTRQRSQFVMPTHIDAQRLLLLLSQVSVVTEMFLDLSLPVSDQVKKKKKMCARVCVLFSH